MPAQFQETQTYRLNPKSQRDANGQSRICCRCGSLACYEHSCGCMISDSCDGEDCHRIVLEDLRVSCDRIFLNQRRGR